MKKYFMDDHREKNRLVEKVIPDEWFDSYFSKVVEPMNSAVSVLDVGCGPGVIASEIAKRMPRSKVFGIDLSDDRLAAAHNNGERRSNVSFSRGDATEIPFENCRFDIVICRFLLEYLQKKELAISEMSRVLKPGGTIVLQDLDGQLVWHDPEPPFLKSLNKTLQVFSSTGFDPYIGRKLFRFAKNCGFEVQALRIEPYHSFFGRIDPVNEDLWRKKLEIAKSAAAEALGGMEEANQLAKDFMAFLCDGETSTYCNIFTLFGRKA